MGRPGQEAGGKEGCSRQRARPGPRLGRVADRCFFEGGRTFQKAGTACTGGGGAAAKQDGGVLRDPTMQDPMGCGKGGCCPPEDLRVKHGQVCLCQRTIANSAHWHGLLCSLGM